MIRYLTLAAVVFLTACSSAPKQTSQFCHTSQTIRTQNGERVNSETVVKCSDDFLERHVPVRMGVDQNCQEVITPYGRNYACQTHRPGHFIYISDPANLK